MESLYKAIGMEVMPDEFLPDDYTGPSAGPLEQIIRTYIILLTTPCLKKLCKIIFCSLSVKYESISVKIGKIVLEETLNKTVPKMPTSPKVCTCTTLGNLKCRSDLAINAVIKCVND